MQTKSSRAELDLILFKSKDEDHTVRNTLLAGGTVAGLGSAAYLTHKAGGVISEAGSALKSSSENARNTINQQLAPAIREAKAAAENVKMATSYTSDFGRFYTRHMRPKLHTAYENFQKINPKRIKEGMQEVESGAVRSNTRLSKIARSLGRFSKRIGLSAKEELDDIMFASDADEQRKMARQAMLKYSLQKSVDNSGNAMTLPGIIGGGIVGSGIAASRGKNALIGAAIGAPVGMLAMRAAGRIDERRRLHRLGNDLQQSRIAKRDTQLSAREELDTILFEGGYSGYTTVTDDEGRKHLVPTKERGVVAHLKRHAATYAGIPLAPIGVIGGLAIDHYRYRSNMGRIAAREGKTLPETF